MIVQPFNCLLDSQGVEIMDEKAMGYYSDVVLLV